MIGRGGKIREFLKKTIANHERAPDQVRKMLELKRKGNATYRMIDVYRGQFLIKHASRHRMRVERKKILAYMEAFIMATGPTWEEGGSPNLEQRQESAHRAYGAAEETVSKREQFRLHMHQRVHVLGREEARRVGKLSRAATQQVWARAAAEWKANEAEKNNATRNAGASRAADDLFSIPEEPLAEEAAAADVEDVVMEEAIIDEPTIIEADAADVKVRAGEPAHLRGLPTGYSERGAR